MDRNFRLILEYDGTDFKGWQVQPDERTVQGELETCLRRLFGKPVRTVAAGRTDAGVHALGQVANFAAETALPEATVRRALNGMLPPDVAVRGIDEVPLEFHSRRDARRRAYHYRIRCGRRAVGRRYAWSIYARLDVARMQEAASRLLGPRDFTSFCVAASERKNRECRLFESVWEQAGDELRFRIQADRFLRTMVRSIVGTLVKVGSGALAPDQISSILDARDRRCAGPSAPPHGLFLERVIYEGRSA